MIVKTSTHLKIIFLSVTMIAELADILPSRVDIRLCVSAHVLDHVAFLGIGPRAVWTLVGSDALMHPNMIQDAPGPSELLVTVVVLAGIHGSDTSTLISALLYRALIVLKELDIFFAFLDVRFLFLRDPIYRAGVIAKTTMDALRDERVVLLHLGGSQVS